MVKMRRERQKCGILRGTVQIVEPAGKLQNFSNFPGKISNENRSV